MFNFKRRPPANRVIPFDSKSAVTVFRTVTLERPKPFDEITPADLENYLAQAVWKFFDRLRSEAAARLQVNEADLLLADVRVMTIKIDGHKIINPEGFRGRNIEFMICLTLIKRDKLPRENEAGTVLEAGSVRAYLTAEKVGLEDIIYVESDSKLTYIYRVTPSYSSYLADFSWGEGDILKALAGELSTDSRLTKELYLQYVGGKVSSRVARKLDKIFYSAFGTFVNGLTMAIKNYSVADKGVFGSKVMEQGNKRQATAVYLESFPLPGTVWDRKFLVGDRKTKFAPAPGVDIDEFGDDKTNGVNERFNCLAKRRIKWLMAR